jgi:hypothetical protein
LLPGPLHSAMTMDCRPAPLLACQAFTTLRKWMNGRWKSSALMFSSSKPASRKVAIVERASSTVTAQPALDTSLVPMPW